MENLDLNRLPQHIAIIMDGNGRWAQEQGQDRLFGHYHGVISVRKVVEAAAEIGIKYLTMYAFSTENWDRPVEEVNGLMTLFVETIAKEVGRLPIIFYRLQEIKHIVKHETFNMFHYFSFTKTIVKSNTSGLVMSH